MSETKKDEDIESLIPFDEAKGNVYSFEEVEWNYNMEEAPLDTPIALLSGDDFPVLPQMEYIGTVSHNGRYLISGECLKGDPEYFYRSAIIAWKPLVIEMEEHYKDE